MATDVVTGTGTGTTPEPRGGAPGTIGRFLQFLRDVRNELRKVTWPTWDELKKATTVIVIFVAILGIMIGLMDTLFQEIFDSLCACCLLQRGQNFFHSARSGCLRR